MIYYYTIYIQTYDYFSGFGKNENDPHSFEEVYFIYNVGKQFTFYKSLKLITKSTYERPRGRHILDCK